MHLAELSEDDCGFLKQVASDALRSAVVEGRCLSADHYECRSTHLLGVGACFVTLLKKGQLRGCIGTLEAYRSLLDDVIHNTYSAAMQDPRFQPVDVDELDAITISISVLTEPELMEVVSEADLLQQLVPGVDGLILQEGSRRATYLPSVWEQLPGRAEFIRELKNKAGFPGNYWSDRVECFRYQVQSVK
ncbi:AmmeMemoRadiSam system protein A [Alkalimarinus coralli]|uniref:AmmeMemoRadiSam system protein A n=1 Tax=Alkalimarinus coralli TaxID=2935863 RepID=UPI00202B1139|nr:AmmeMemoRadiSam system protein A [Alkalimarinus coralli]